MRDVERTSRSVALWRLRLPLRQPYKLSFGAVEAFDTVLVRIELDGVVGWGDATVLTGYTEETIDGAWRLASELAPHLSEETIASLWQLTQPHLATAPFTVTAFRTACEMALRHPVLLAGEERRVPLLKILNAEDEDALAGEIEDGLAAGYGTFKIKVGFRLEGDLARVALIQRLNAGRARLTIDANQGYTPEDGRAFAERVPQDDVMFFEQACNKDDWDAAIDVARSASRRQPPLPVMLDEQIYDLDDVERAARLGAATFVKLKLMKFGSLDALLAGLDRTRALGLRPVLGNGVATDIGCWMEACAGHGGLDTAGEMNGFLKPIRPIIANPLRVEAGRVVVPRGYWPEVDLAAIETQTVDRASYGSVLRILVT